jgi:hypothetical protein
VNVQDCGNEAARELERVEKLTLQGSPEAVAAAYWRAQYVSARDDLALGARVRVLNEESAALLANVASLPRSQAVVDDLLERLDLQERYEKAPTRLCSVWYGAWALRLLLEKRTRAEILAELSDYPWKVKNQMLGRWIWMTEERKLITLSQQSEPAVDCPYQCRVPKFDRPGGNLGREIDTLVCFLPRYREVTGVELLIRAKSETPDFEVEKPDGCIIGVEVTDAPERVGEESNLYREVEDEESVRKRLVPILRRRGLWIEFEDSSSWAERRRVADQICERVDAVCSVPGRIELRREGIRISAELVPSQSPGVGDRAWGDVSEKVVEGVLFAVQKKLKRLQPQIRPCLLVIYPASRRKVDRERVLPQLRSRLSREDIATHFDEIWLCREDFTERLWPEGACSGAQI